MSTHAVTPSASTSTSSGSSPPSTLVSLSRDHSADVSFDSVSSLHSSSSFIGKGHALAGSEDYGMASSSPEDMGDGQFATEFSIPLANRYPGVAKTMPLSPHRLARLANSFGVSTPVPHSAPPNSGSRRSVSSGSYSRSRVTTATRLLLHVIPPAHLPADAPATSSAPGYHHQMRRGTLIPLHATLQGQLGAIAREFNLPSTGGIVVYLLDARDDDMAEEFFGPKISDEAWKLLWSRALQTDREETARSFLTVERMHSSPPSPVSMEDGDSPDSPTVLSNTELDSSGHSDSRALRPLRTGKTIRAMPSSTTLSSTASMHSTNSSSSRRPSLPSQSAPPRSITSSPAMSTTTTSRSFFASPVVGKIEFDIDRRKAAWYEPWLRRNPDRLAIIPPSLTLPSSSSPLSSNHRPLLLTERLTQKGAERFNPTEPIGRDRPAAHSSGPSNSSLHGWFFEPGVTTPITPLNDDAENGFSDARSGYAPLPDDEGRDANVEDEVDEANEVEAEETDEADESDEMYASNAETQSIGLGINLGGAGDEEDWRELRETSMLADRTVVPRGEEPDLEGEIEELDPIGVSSATQDIEEVMSMWNAHTDPEAPEPLSSPIMLRTESETPTLPDGPDISPFTTPNRLRSGSLSSRRAVPPPLNLHKEPKPIFQLSPSTPLPSAPLDELTGMTTPDPEDDEGSESTDDSDSDDDVESVDTDTDAEVNGRESQIMMRKELDVLEKHLAQVSPRMLDKLEPTLTPRRSSHDLLGRVGASPRLPDGFARPNPGQTLISANQSSAYVWPQTPPVINDPRNPPPTTPASFSDLANASRDGTQPRINAVDENYFTPRPAPSVHHRPPTPAAIEPPPRVSSLPQPSSRFSADSAASEVDDNSGGRLTVRTFSKLFRRSGSKNRDSSRASREYPVPPMPNMNSIASVSTSPKRNGVANPSPTTPAGPSKAPSHTRSDSGLDPFQFDQEERYPSLRSPSPGSAPLPPSEKAAPSQPITPGAAKLDRSVSSAFRTRGILKGWGSKTKSPAAPPTSSAGEFSGRSQSPADASKQSLDTEQSRPASALRSPTPTSISTSMISAPIAENGVTRSATMRSNRSAQSIIAPSISSTDETSPNQSRFSVARSLRPPSSPSSTNSSWGARPSIDEPPTPRLSQFEIMTPPIRNIALDT